MAADLLFIVDTNSANGPQRPHETAKEWYVATRYALSSKFVEGAVFIKQGWRKRKTHTGIIIKDYQAEPLSIKQV